MTNLRVLLIDDEEELVSTLVERLAIRNIDAQSVGDGATALKLMAHELFDAVVLDLRMPGMDGLEVLNRIKKEHPEVKVILMTGQGSLDIKIAATPPEAFDALLKPVNIDLLVRKLNATRENH